jgi:hypothetical protein
LISGNGLGFKNTKIIGRNIQAPTIFIGSTSFLQRQFGAKFIRVLPTKVTF